MKKITIILATLFSVNTFAMHCPLPSDLKHIKGYPWELSPEFVNQGWKITSDATASCTELTRLNDDTRLLIQLYPQNSLSPITENCNYKIGKSQDGWIWVTHSKTFDPSRIPIPPFEHTISNGYKCNTTAGNALYCSWETTSH